MRQMTQTRLVGFRAPDVLVAKIEEKARSEGMSLSEYLRDLSRRDIREAA